MREGNGGVPEAQRRARLPPSRSLRPLPGPVPPPPPARARVHSGMSSDAVSVPPKPGIQAAIGPRVFPGQSARRRIHSGFRPARAGASSRPRPEVISASLRGSGQEPGAPTRLQRRPTGPRAGAARAPPAPRRGARLPPSARPCPGRAASRSGKARQAGNEPAGLHRDRKRLQCKVPRERSRRAGSEPLGRAGGAGSGVSSGRPAPSPASCLPPHQNPGSSYCT